MTRLEIFLKLFPNATMDSCGYPQVFPCDIDAEYYKETCDGRMMACGQECDAKFWNEEVKA